MINQQLAALSVPTGTIWIYTDGSAVTGNLKTGAYASMILFSDGSSEMVIGCQNWTTINRKELLAVNEALHYLWRWKFNKILMDKPIVQIICDSTYVVDGATGKSSRTQNQDIWAGFDVLIQPFEISIEHISRNLEPAQAQADAGCSLLREIFHDWLEKFTTHNDFAKFGMNRKTQI